MDDRTFVSRSIKTALIAGAIVFVFVVQKVPLPVVWGGVLGILASVSNLYLLSLIAKTLLIPPAHFSNDQKRMAIFYATLKFPIFYGLLVFILYKTDISLYALMAGFTFPLLVMTLKSVGKVCIENNLQRGFASGE
jgi:hypothetical protein